MGPPSCHIHSQSHSRLQLVVTMRYLRRSLTTFFLTYFQQQKKSSVHLINRRESSEIQKRFPKNINQVTQLWRWFFFPPFDLISFVNYHIFTFGIKSEKQRGKKMIISRQIPFVLQNEPSPRTWFTCFLFFRQFIGIFQWIIHLVPTWWSKLGNWFSRNFRVNYFHLLTFGGHGNRTKSALVKLRAGESVETCFNSFHLLHDGTFLFFGGNLDWSSAANVYSTCPSPTYSKILIVIKLPPADLDAVMS